MKFILLIVFFLMGCLQNSSDSSASFNNDFSEFTEMDSSQKEKRMSEIVEAAYNRDISDQELIFLEYIVRNEVWYLRAHAAGILDKVISSEFLTNDKRKRIITLITELVVYPHPSVQEPAIQAYQSHDLFNNIPDSECILILEKIISKSSGIKEGRSKILSVDLSFLKRVNFSKLSENSKISLTRSMLFYIDFSTQKDNPFQLTIQNESIALAFLAAHTGEPLKNEKIEALFLIIDTYSRLDITRTIHALEKYDLSLMQTWKLSRAKSRLNSGSSSKPFLSDSDKEYLQWIMILSAAARSK